VQAHALVATGLTGVQRNTGFRQATGFGNEGEQRRIGATIDGWCIEPDLEAVAEEACKFRARRTRLDANVEHPVRAVAAQWCGHATRRG